MKAVYILPIIAVVLALRLWMRHRNRQKRAAAESVSGPVTTGATGTDASGEHLGETTGDASALPVTSGPTRGRYLWSPWFGRVLGDAGLVAQREILDRVRGRIFKVGTLLILLGVAAAIVIPKLHTSSTTPAQQVGVVGRATPGITEVIKYSGRQTQTPVQIVPQQSLAAAEAALRSGKLDLAIVDGDRIVVNQPLSGKGQSTTSGLVEVLAPELGVLHTYQSAGLSPAQI
jgi:hypothetical protein